MALWTDELEHADCCEVDEHKKDLISKEISDSYVSHDEPGCGPAWDYITRSEVEKLMEDNIKDAVKFDTRLLVTGIVEETIED